MTFPVTQTQTVAAFRCVGDQCPDTCCKGWGMQLTQETLALYKEQAPELVEAVTSGEAELIMKRDPQTDHCVKFEQGWCGIHARYGEQFLGDACHFFPRATRLLGERLVMTASMACPEIVRLAWRDAAPTAYEAGEVARVPYALKQYLPEGIDDAQAWAMHEAVLASVRGAPSAERALVRLNAVARSLDVMPKAQWAEALPFYLAMAEGRLPPPEANASDPFNLLNALQGLIGAAQATKRERLMQTVADMAEALKATLDWQTLGIELDAQSGMQYLRMEALWRTHAPHYAPLLLRWLEMQLALALFPFAGFGETLAERVSIIGVRLATVKLALMAAVFRTQGALAEEDVVRVVQSLARFMDHLADPTLSLRIYTETGWVREARMRALLGDAP